MYLRGNYFRKLIKFIKKVKVKINNKKMGKN